MCEIERQVIAVKVDDMPQSQTAPSSPQLQFAPPGQSLLVAVGCVLLCVREMREMEKQVVTMKVDDASVFHTVPLTAQQSSDIDELMRAYHSSLDISMDNDPPRDRANFSDLINIAELSVRRVIAMAKQVIV